MIYKKILSLLITFSLIFYFLFYNVYAINTIEDKKFKKDNLDLSINVNAKAAILMEPSTGKVIVQKNAHEQLPPASVTKIMTMLLIYEAIFQGKIAWDDTVTISEHAANMGGSQIYLEPGEQQTVSELTKSIVVSSANDAAVAMAEYLAGSEENFVVQMNKKARELGMLNTNFVNACGLDVDGHLTTAYDIALMSKELITKYPDVFKFTTIWMDKITHKTSRGEEEFGLANTNKMIKIYKGITGLKTGSTSKALFCISATAEKDGLSLIAVILGAPTSPIRFDEARKLLDYGFSNYKLSCSEVTGTEKGEVKVYKGEKDTVKAVIKNQTNILIAKGNNIELESRVELLDGINAPVKEGTKIGEVIYISSGNEVGRSDLVAYNSVNKANLGHMMKRLLLKWFE